MKRAVLAAAAFLLTGASWIDPHAKAREASVSYDKGDFAAATQKYNEALTDDPDSFLLQYNRGASLYRESKFDEAASAYGRAPSTDTRHPVGSAEIAELAYNMGNAKYRQGAAVADSDPQKALGLYAEALAAYRRAMGAAPQDVDAKFNHELVEKKIETLRKKLEEQQQEQQQQQSDPQSQEEQDQQERAEQQQGRQQDGQQDRRPESETEESAEQREQSAEEQAPQGEPQPEDAAQPRQESTPQQATAGDESSQQQPPAQPTVSGERREGEMSEREARALLDAARDQEVRPDEIIERMQGGSVLEPSQDW